MINSPTAQRACKSLSSHTSLPGDAPAHGRRASASSGGGARFTRAANAVTAIGQRGGVEDVTWDTASARRRSIGACEGSPQGLIDAQRGNARLRRVLPPAATRPWPTLARLERPPTCRSRAAPTNAGADGAPPGCPCTALPAARPWRAPAWRGIAPRMTDTMPHAGHPHASFSQAQLGTVAQTLKFAAKFGAARAPRRRSVEQRTHQRRRSAPCGRRQVC